MDEVEFEEAPVRSEKAKEWQRDRARRVKRSENERPQDYSAIVFPDCPGLCHAARVVAGRMVATTPDLLEAIDATRDVLDMLGIIEVMNNGGDGRKVKVQRGPVRLPGDEDIPPDWTGPVMGYGDDDEPRGRR